ncbi:hypothetical protein [Kitasatospora cinereorecta]|uniref:Lipoprotein n=1 Tax=Kitasatospora cinereorecta TaxID=285560 RepID=A0ABW0V8Q4_9ACTN
MVLSGGCLTTRDMRIRTAWRAAALLLAGGLAAGCGSGGPTVGDSDASCSLSARPTVTGVVTAYEVTLSAATDEKGYFSPTASVTVSGGQAAPVTTDVTLGSPISVPRDPGIYIVQAAVPLKADAPHNYRAVSCRMTLTVNSSG